MRRCRAAVTRIDRGAVLAGIVGAALVSSVLWPGVAFAQDPDAAPGEIPIGTFHIGTPQNGLSVQEPPAGVPESRRQSDDDSSGSWFFQSWDGEARDSDSAGILLNQAKAALAAGRVADAQRLLERLVAENPDSALAAEARQHLGRLYRTAAGTDDSERAQGKPDAQLPWSPPREGPSSPQAAAAGNSVSPAALRKARASGILDEQFLSQAGDRVFFSAGSAELGVRARGVIQAQARFLVQHPELSAAIEGHADDGAIPDEETIRLSEARAAAVRDRLIAEGIPTERLLVLARGRQDRVSDCPAPQCLAQNRRAITILLDRGPDADGARATRRAQGGGQGTQAPPTTQ